MLQCPPEPPCTVSLAAASVWVLRRRCILGVWPPKPCDAVWRRDAEPCEKVGRRERAPASPRADTHKNKLVLLCKPLQKLAAEVYVGHALLWTQGAE
eukprot:1159177-Pelagomonas_calceolata.AAC.9